MANTHIYKKKKIVLGLIFLLASFIWIVAYLTYPLIDSAEVPQTINSILTEDQKQRIVEQMKSIDVELTASEQKFIRSEMKAVQSLATDEEQKIFQEFNKY